MSASYRDLSGSDVRELLGELLERLAVKGVQVEAYIVGGAAMALHLGREQLTPDIDGIFAPEDEVLAEAAKMASEHGLAPEWVNSRFVSFMAFSPKDDVDAVTIELRGHKVTIASKRVLLAMKIAASRSKDYTDTNRLILDLGITDAEELVDLVFSLFGEGNMTVSEDRAEVRLIVEEALRRAARAQTGVALIGTSEPTPFDRRNRAAAPVECSALMPRAKRACVLRYGHRGHHRSKRPAS